MTTNKIDDDNSKLQLISSFNANLVFVFQKVKLAYLFESSNVTINQTLTEHCVSEIDCENELNLFHPANNELQRFPSSSNSIHSIIFMSQTKTHVTNLDENNQLIDRNEQHNQKGN